MPCGTAGAAVDPLVLHAVRHSLVLVEEARVDCHVLLYPLTHLNAEAELPEQVAQSVAVDQLDGRGAIPGVNGLTI
jgi:hypothetical protein